MERLKDSLDEMHLYVNKSELNYSQVSGHDC